MYCDSGLPAGTECVAIHPGVLRLGSKKARLGCIAIQPSQAHDTVQAGALGAQQARGELGYDALVQALALGSGVRHGRTRLVAGGARQRVGCGLKRAGSCDTAAAPATRPAGTHDTAPLRPRHDMRACAWACLCAQAGRAGWVSWAKLVHHALGSVLTPFLTRFDSILFLSH